MKLLIVALLAFVAIVSAQTEAPFQDICCYRPSRDVGSNATYLAIEDDVCGPNRGFTDQTYRRKDANGNSDECRRGKTGPYDFDARARGPNPNYCTDVFDNNGEYNGTCSCVTACAWCGGCGTQDALEKISVGDLTYTMHDLLFFTSLEQFVQWYEDRCEAYAKWPADVNLTAYEKDLNCTFNPPVETCTPCPPPPIPCTPVCTNSTNNYCVAANEPLCDIPASQFDQETNLNEVNRLFSLHTCGLKYNPSNDAVEDCDDLNFDPDCPMRYRGDLHRRLPCNLQKICTHNPTSSTSSGINLSSSQATVAYVIGAAVMAGLIGAMVVVRKVMQRRRRLTNSASAQSVELGMSRSPSFLVEGSTA